MLRSFAFLLALAALAALAPAASAQAPAPPAEPAAEPAACVVSQPDVVRGARHTIQFENTCPVRVWLIVTSPYGRGAKAHLGWRRRFLLSGKSKLPVSGQFRPPELVAVCAYGDDECIAKSCNDGTGTECMIRGQ